MIKKRTINKDKLLYVYSKKSYKLNTNITVYQEVLRYNFITGLIKLFITETKKLNLPNYSLLLKYNKLNEIIQKWCWFQYNNERCKDSVIPYVDTNEYDYSIYVGDINSILNINIIENNIIELKKNISYYLYNSYKLFKKLLKKNNKIILTINKNKNNVVFTVNILENLEYINNTIVIDVHKELYNRLLSKLQKFSNINMYNDYIFCLIFRYSYIDSGNQQLAINKKVKDIFKNFGVDFETFGSAINVVSNYYCSLFYDIEKYFGSQGNFFDINIAQGLYWCNPPYINVIMANSAKKILNIIKNNNNVGFIITIPIWDQHTQNLNFNKITKNNNINFDQELYKDYEAYYILKPFIKYELIIPKKRIPYFNFRLHKDIYAVDTYMLLIYNKLQPIYIKYLHEAFDKIITLDKTNYFINN